MKNDWESWHLHHLARRAKLFGLDKKITDAINIAGWYLAKGEEIPPSVHEILEESLSRLAKIPDFEKTCDDKNCEICKKIKRYQSDKDIKKIPYKLVVEPYRWQKEAKKIWWDNNGKGIVKVVTGAGKTILAFSIISDLYNSLAYRDGGLRTIIVVPTSPLLDQWFDGLVHKLNIPENDIAVYYGKKKQKIDNKKFILYVVNSAREYIKEHYEANFKKEEIFLIADECHRYGSKENSKIFEIRYSYTLGLSATPEREGDYGFEERILPSLGKIIYEYSYKDALIDGIIPPYKLIRIKVKLTEQESFQYENFTAEIIKIKKKIELKYPEISMIKPFEFFKKLGSIYENTQDELIKRYISLLNLRKSIIHNSISKLLALKWLILNENLKNEKVLIFHERIEYAEKIYEFLKNKGFSVGVYHANMDMKRRIDSIAKYRIGEIMILISCHALDEGFDVPDTNTGIIIAGTSSVRQWIQRMGRILRKTPGKEYSKIYVVFEDIFEKDVFKETELREFENESLSIESIDLSFE